MFFLTNFALAFYRCGYLILKLLYSSSGQFTMLSICIVVFCLSIGYGQISESK